MKEFCKFTVLDNDKTVELTFLEANKLVSRDGEIIYARTYAQCVRSGLLTNAEASKLASERGGVFTETEKDDYVKSLTDYVTKDAQVKIDKEAAKDTTALEKEVEELKNKILFYQKKQDNIFEYTAESKARDAVIMHYALSLTMKDGKAFFEGKDYDTRVKNLDERTDTLKDSVFGRAIWYSTAMFYGVKNINEAKYPEDVPAVSSSSPANNP